MPKLRVKFNAQQGASMRVDVDREASMQEAQARVLSAAGLGPSANAWLSLDKKVCTLLVSTAQWH